MKTLSAKKTVAAALALIFGWSLHAAAQNLFVSGYQSGNIYQFMPGGVQIGFASGLNGPQGLAFNSAGNLFVADYGYPVAADYANDITEITPGPGGARTTVASGLGATSLAFNSAGYLFVGSWGNGSITKISTSGAQSTFATGLNQPSGLAFNSAGDLFEADNGSGNIYEFTPDGTQSTFASGLVDLEGLAFNSAGDLFAAGGISGNIYEIALNGVQSTFASGLGAPISLAFDSAGDLFVGNGGSFSGNITEITPGGVHSIFASGLDESPDGLAFQPVPEPSTWAMLAGGLTALLSVKRRLPFLTGTVNEVHVTRTGTKCSSPIAPNQLKHEPLKMP